MNSQLLAVTSNQQERERHELFALEVAENGLIGKNTVIRPFKIVVLFCIFMRIQVSTFSQKKHTHFSLKIVRFYVIQVVDN